MIPLGVSGSKSMCRISVMKSKTSGLWNHWRSEGGGKHVQSAEPILQMTILKKEECSKNSNFSVTGKNDPENHLGSCVWQKNSSKMQRFSNNNSKVY
jgi:hypothetical protein